MMLTVSLILLQIVILSTCYDSNHKDKNLTEIKEVFVPIVHNYIDKLLRNSDQVKLNTNYKSIMKSYDPNKNIPLNIHQIWPSKELMPLMNKSVETLLLNNPEFKYYLYDDNDCRYLISKYFDSDTLKSFDKLIPGAYKADLCRYCALYHYGGVYLDIKYTSIGKFKLLSLVDKEYYTIDMYFSPYEDYTLPLYNAFMITYKNSIVLKTVINSINEHVKLNYYGLNVLYPTGPVALGQAYLGSPREVKKHISTAVDKLSKLELVYHYYDNRTKISYYDKPILQSYNRYRTEQSIYYKKNNIKRYNYYWDNRIVYNNSVN